MTAHADENWEVLPLRGLGKMSFGISPSSFAERDDIYGEREISRPSGPDLLTLEQTLRDAGTFSEEAIATILAASGDQDAALAGMVDEVRANGLQSTFQHDRLVGFFTDFRTRDLHIEGDLFYGTEPLLALRRLQSMNEKPPLVNGLDCVFDQIKVITYGFVAQAEDGYSLLQSAALVGNQGEHSVSWGENLDRAAEDLALYTRVQI